jgi:hypothetical protein
MSVISLNRFPLVSFIHEQVPLAWDKVNSYAKDSSFFAAIRDEDPFLWENFKKKLQAQPSSAQEKVRNIFKKHGIDEKKKNLDKKYVHLALSALYTPYIADLGENATKMNPEEVEEKVESLFKGLPPMPTPKPIDDGLKGVYKILSQDAISRDMEKTLFLRELSKLTTHQSYWEYLTKYIAGRDLEAGMLIPAFGGSEFYYVYKKINKSGLFAYALKPLYEKSDLSPVLFFRPTQMSVSAEKMIETLMDNFSLHGVGYEGFYAAEKELTDLMKDEKFRPNHEKIIVAGYSLAGVHAQRFISHHDHWRHFSEAIIFNSPGIDEKTAKKFAFKVNMGSFLLPHTPSLSFYRTEGDVIDQGGERHLGSGVFPSSNICMQLTKVFPYNSLDNSLTRHISCYLHGDHEVEVLDVKKSVHHHHLNNAKRGKELSFLEKLRQVTGLIFKPIYYVFFFITWLVDIIFLPQTVTKIRLLFDSSIRWIKNEKE